VATVQATAEELFEIIQDLREQRAKADAIKAAGTLPSAGTLEVWERRTLDLIRQALGDEHYDYAAFQHATGPMTIAPPMATPTQQEAVRIRNLQRRLEPHPPPLDDAIEEAEKKLSRMSGGIVPTGYVAPPTSALPRVEFAFVKDVKLRAIAERDYAELRVAAYYQSHKSKALLAGSVIEAVVLDLLLQRAIPFTELDRLTAYGLYERAKKEGLLPGRQSSAADASRDTRNFVHPAVEYREGSLTREQADLALSLMKAILGELRVLPA
jgi:hypothetical protein